MSAGSPPSGTRILDLDIEGMTCASCAQRIERKLNRIPGATATVNLATERARVALPAASADAVALAAVSEAGYRATPRVERGAGTARGRAADGSDSGSAAGVLRRRLLVSAILAVPVLALSMIPAAQFDGWQWVALVLATPVAIWGAWPFHRIAVMQARHRGLSMDTLISLGVAAAYLWSVSALFFGGAGRLGMHMSLHLVGRPGSQADDVYFEVASVVTVFLLAGRYLEARARVRSGAALRSLLELGALEASRVVDGSEERILVSELAVGDVFVVRPGEKIATDGIVIAGVSAVDASLLTGESVPIEVGVDADVAGGTINVGGHLTVRATRVGSETQLAHISRLVEEAQTGKADVQRLADRVSGVFVPWWFCLPSAPSRGGS